MTQEEIDAARAHFCIPESASDKGIEETCSQSVWLANYRLTAAFGDLKCAMYEALPGPVQRLINSART